MTDSINVSVVFNNGSVDEVATLAACQERIQAYVIEREAEQNTLSEVVNQVFDSLNGVRASVPYVINTALLKLNVSSAAYKTVEKRIGDYIRSHSGDRESGMPFNIAKGKGGGVCRWSDFVEKK